MFIKNEYAKRKLKKGGGGGVIMCHDQLWVQCINEEVTFYILFYSQTRSSFSFSIDMHTFLKLKAYLVIPALIVFTNKSWWFLAKTCFFHIPLDKPHGRCFTTTCATSAYHH